MQNIPLDYYYGQGRLSAAIRDAVTGLPGKFMFLGDVSAFSVKLSADKITTNESFSGTMAETVSISSKKTATVDMTWKTLNPDNLAIALYGKKVVIPTGEVTDEALDATLAVNDTFYLANPGVSDLVISDSTAGAAKTLVEGTDYSLDDANFGRCTLLKTAGFTMPLKADYSYTARVAVGLMTNLQQNIALRYEGVNLANGNEPVMVDLYKVATDPLAELPLITTGNDVAGVQVTGGVLADPSKPNSAELGQIGSIQKITPVAA